MKVSVLFFFPSSRPQVASLDTSPHTIRHYTSLLLGVRKMKFDAICPHGANMSTTPN